MNAALFYDLGDWSLGLHFENITDEEYFTRGFGATSVIPAPGLTVAGRLSRTGSGCRGMERNELLTEFV